MTRRLRKLATFRTAILSCVLVLQVFVFCSFIQESAALRIAFHQYSNPIRLSSHRHTYTKKGKASNRIRELNVCNNASRLICDSVKSPNWRSFPKVCLWKRDNIRSVCFAAAKGEGDVSWNREEEKCLTNERNNFKISGVTLKLAIDSSKDWGVAELKEGSSIERFTSPASLDMVHRLRRDSDYVLVGKNTVLVDDCSLTVRRVELLPDRQQPTRVILDPKLSLLPCDANQYKKYTIFNDGLDTLLYFSMTLLSPSEQIQMQLLASNNQDQTDGNSNLSDISWSKSVTLVDTDSLSHLNNSSSSSGTPETSLSLAPEVIVNDLHARWRNKKGKETSRITYPNEESHIMVEGGPMTARAFLGSKLIDRVILVRAPLAFEQPLKSGLSRAYLEKSGLQCLGSNCENFDGDTVEYWSRPGLDWPSATGNIPEKQATLWDWP